MGGIHKVNSINGYGRSHSCLEEFAGFLGELKEEKLVNNVGTKRFAGCKPVEGRESIEVIDTQFNIKIPYMKIRCHSKKNPISQDIYLYTSVDKVKYVMNKIVQFCNRYDGRKYDGN